MAQTNTRNILLWILQVLVAVPFLFFGFSLLRGVPELAQAFVKIGWGDWFRYVTGGLEMIGGIALLIPGYAFYGASLLAAIMASAIVFHLTKLGGSPVPAIVFLVLSGVIAYFRKP